MSVPKALGLGVLQTAGLVGGATVWAVNTELGQILPSMDCVRQSHITALAAFAGVFMAVSAGLLSWLLAITLPSEGSTMTGRFIGSLSGLAGLLFAFALGLQGTAALVLSGCER